MGFPLQGLAQTVSNNRIKHDKMKKVILVIALLFIVIIGYFLFINHPEGRITFLDYPVDLSGETDTIEVTYIAWACACPNWIETDFIAQNSYIPENELENKCFFIEANSETLKLPVKYHTNFLDGKRFRIKLIGSFYENKGISRDYEKPTSEKPEHAKVFRYNKFEVLGL